MKRIIITIDGPAGSGKSTTAKLLASKIGYNYLDTGAMYRAVALATLKHNVELSEEAICKLMDKIKIGVIFSEGGQLTLLDGLDVSEDIRLPEVTKLASGVSALKCVRNRLVLIQRDLGKNGGIVIEGRDAGTNIFPKAELKIFLSAKPEVRAERRFKEYMQKGLKIEYDDVLNDIISRDRNDSTRILNPLARADDAIEVDTSNMTIEKQVEALYKLASDGINKAQIMKI